MAVAVPFIMSATGASAAIGAAVGLSATMVSTLTTIAFSVTGISAKINKAAGKVFGEDLVNFANIAGAAYSMFNGGFDLGGTPDPNAMNVPTGAESGDLFQSQMSAQGFEPVSIDTTNSVFDRVGLEPEALTSEAWDAAGAENYAAATEAAQGVNITNGEQLMTDAKPLTNAPIAPFDEKTLTSATQTPQGDGAAGSGAAKVDAARVNAAGAKAAAPGATAPPPQLAPAANQQNLFEKLFYTTDKAGNSVINDRMVGGVLQGVGGAVGGYMTSQQQQRALDFQRQKYNTRPLGRIIN